MIADDIEQEFGHEAKGFGSIRVRVTIGSSRWSTSLFPDTKRATYVLPVKKANELVRGPVVLLNSAMRRDLSPLVQP